ncbi:MAG: thiol peroxidase [Nocardioides sp.]
MATTHLGDVAVTTSGEPPAVGSKAPDFTLLGADFSEVSLTPGTRTVLNIFPSVDTGVCSASVRKFNELVADLDNTQVICVSADLPFALGRFCGAEGIESVVTASTLRSDFADVYGVRMVDGKFENLLARTVVVIDTDGTVLHTEMTNQVGEAVDFDAVVAALA